MQNLTVSKPSGAKQKSHCSSRPRPCRAVGGGGAAPSLAPLLGVGERGGIAARQCFRRGRSEARAEMHALTTVVLNEIEARRNSGATGRRSVRRWSRGRHGREFADRARPARPARDAADNRGARSTGGARSRRRRPGQGGHARFCPVWRRAFLARCGGRQRYRAAAATLSNPSSRARLMCALAHPFALLYLSPIWSRIARLCGPRPASCAAPGRWAGADDNAPGLGRAWQDMEASGDVMEEQARSRAAGGLQRSSLCSCARIPRWRRLARTFWRR